MQMLFRNKKIQKGQIFREIIFTKFFMKLISRKKILIFRILEHFVLLLLLLLLLVWLIFSNIWLSNYLSPFTHNLHTVSPSWCQGWVSIKFCICSTVISLHWVWFCCCNCWCCWDSIFQCLSRTTTTLLNIEML